VADVVISYARSDEAARVASRKCWTQQASTFGGMPTCWPLLTLVNYAFTLATARESCYAAWAAGAGACPGIGCTIWIRGRSRALTPSKPSTTTSPWCSFARGSSRLPARFGIGIGLWGAFLRIET